jgi:chemotaxis protein CheD
MNRLYDARFARDRLLLHPGEHAVSDDDVVLSTVLGSCVSVCLRDATRGIAGMNHFMLPAPLPTSRFFSSDAGRFGLHAMELVINAMLARGATRSRLRAKVFGGAHVLSTGVRSDRVPTANVEFALAYLEAEGIPLLAQDLGGLRARKLSFIVRTGEVFVQKLRAAHPTEVLVEEDAYRAALAAETRRKQRAAQVLFDAPAGEPEIELFDARSP